MDWTKAPQGRLLAAAYIGGFLATLIGVGLILYGQASGSDGPSFVVGVVAFAIGQLIVTGLAFGLRGHLPAKPAARPQDAFQRAWHRLSLGLELPSAVRLLRR